MDDDDLDLVESDDEDTAEYSNYERNAHIHNINPLHPLSRNIANPPVAIGLEQIPPGKLFSKVER